MAESKSKEISRPVALWIVSIGTMVLGLFTIGIGALGSFLGQSLNEPWVQQLWVSFATNGIILFKWPTALIDVVVGLIYLVSGYLVFKARNMELGAVMSLGAGILSLFIFGVGGWSTYIQEVIYKGLTVVYLRIVLQGVIPLIFGVASISLEKEEAKTVLGRRIRGFWIDFSHNKVGLVGAAIVFSYIVATILVPVLSFGIEPETTDLADDLVPPEWITFFNPSLNSLPRSEYYLLNPSLDYTSIPEFLNSSSNEGKFYVNQTPDSVTLRFDGVEFSDENPICIAIDFGSFNYPYVPPRGGGFSIRFGLSADPKYSYNITNPVTGENTTVSVVRAQYNAEVNFTNPLNTYSIWDAEWSINKLTYFSLGYNQSGLLEPIDLPPASDRLVKVKQSFDAALSTDIYWAYRMGFTDAHGSVDSDGLSNTLFGSQGNYSLKMYVFVAPISGKPVYFTFSVKPLSIKIKGLLWGLMGTDHLGRDVWSRVVHGIKISLAIGLAAAVTSTLMGIIVGVASGYLGGIVDEALMRLVDILLCLPVLPLLMMLVYMYGRNVWYIVILIAIFGWQGLSRVIRSQVLSLREAAFVECAIASGASKAYIMFRHLVPNVLPIVLADFVLSVPGAIMTEASLSFIGFGDPTTPTWGREFNIMWTEGGAFSQFAWWWIFPPGIAITLLCAAFIFLGHAVDEIVNPRLRRRR